MTPANKQISAFYKFEFQMRGIYEEGILQLIFHRDISKTVIIET